MLKLREPYLMLFLTCVFRLLERRIPARGNCGLRSSGMKKAYLLSWIR
jgi:hypothetical protein